MAQGSRLKAKGKKLGLMANIRFKVEGTTVT